MIRHIESKDNKYVKIAKSLSMKKYREKYSLFFAEGRRIVAEALSVGSAEFVILSESFFAKNPDFSNEDVLTLVVSDAVFKDICDTENSQGALAAVRISQIPQDLDLARFALILDGVSEPGNMGTIIRSAEALGVDIIYTTGGCVDVYNPKTVRSTMGSIFRMPIVFGKNSAEIFDILKERGFTVCASSLSAKKSISDISDCGKIALVIGSEARGISPETEAGADILFKIPMRGAAESLNASVAAGIAMYELGRKVL